MRGGRGAEAQRNRGAEEQSYVRLRIVTPGEALRRIGAHAVPMPRVTYRWEVLRS